jgi:hypothetical protein
MLGQELVKITVMDFVMTIGSTLIMDFFRALWVRYLNAFWCWDLEKFWPEYGEFNVAENVLHLINNQGMIWMGMFFSPGLPLLNLFKLVLLVYLRSWIVMTCNIPHETVFRASRSNNFYFGLLLLFLFLCTLPVGYFIVWLPPSWHCGPFSNYERMYKILTRRLLDATPEWAHMFLDYISSPGVIIPLLLLLTLFIYYLISLAGALRESNDDLKIQLRRERTEERRKMFKLAEKKDDVEATGSKWNALFPHLRSRLSSTLSEKPSTEAEREERAKEVLRRYVRKRRERKRAEKLHKKPETAEEAHDQLPMVITHENESKKDKNDKKKRQQQKPVVPPKNIPALRKQPSLSTALAAGPSKQSPPLTVPVIKISREESVDKGSKSDV